MILGRTFYALRQKGTDRFLTMDTRHRGTGVTHREPSEDGVPFLYLTERGANQALKLWKKGALTVRWVGGGSMFSDDGPEEDWQTHPIPGRDEIEIEVTALTLAEKCETVAPTS